MKFGLSEETINKINAIFSKYPEVEIVIIYGSRAKGDYREGSDIDITLKGKDLTNKILSKIQGDLDDLNNPYLFDVSIFDHLQSPDLEDHIKRVGQIFYNRSI